MLKSFLFTLFILIGLSCIHIGRSASVEEFERQLTQLNRLYTLDKFVGDLRRTGFSVTYVKTSKFNSVFDLTEVAKLNLNSPISPDSISQAISAVAIVSNYNPSTKEISIITKDAEYQLSRPPLNNSVNSMKLTNRVFDDSLKELSAKFNYSIIHFSLVSSSTKKTIINLDVNSNDLITILRLIMNQTNNKRGWTLALSVDEEGQSPFASVYTYN